MYNKKYHTILITLYLSTKTDPFDFVHSLNVLLNDISSKYKKLEEQVCVISCYGILATISDYTRVFEDSKSGIDNILTILTLYLTTL